MDKIRRANKRDFFIAQNMIFDLDISEHAKITYLYLCRCADDESQAFPSYNTIAQKCSFSRRTALRAVQKLQEVGLLSVENRKILKKGKLVNTSNLYILYDSPNEGVVTHSHQGGDTQSPGVVTHSHQGGDTQSPRTIPNYKDPVFINTQSVSQKKPKKEKQPAGNMTDRQTEFKNIESYFEEQLGFDALKTTHESYSKLIDEIKFNILEMYFNEYTMIKGERKPMMIVRSALMKLTHWHIVNVFDKYINLNTKITNPKAYMQTMIYNIAFESDLAMTNQVKSDGL
ncbi:MAG: helix-turn-helix domain-containing protein [Clostridiales bacterium]|nr:helix-turn-helix domain-containing protein [Clostridiales bacterium]